MEENQISGWVSLVFARKQMFNPRPITKTDKKGLKIPAAAPASGLPRGCILGCDMRKCLCIAYTDFFAFFVFHALAGEYAPHAFYRRCVPCPNRNAAAARRPKTI